MQIEFEVEPVNLPILRMPKAAHPKHEKFIQALVDHGVLSESLEDILIQFDIRLRAGYDCYKVTVHYTTDDERTKYLKYQEEADRKKEENKIKWAEGRLERVKEERKKTKQREYIRWINSKPREVSARMIRSKILHVSEGGFDERAKCLSGWLKKERRDAETSPYYHVAHKRDRLCILIDDEYGKQRWATEVALGDSKRLPSERFFGKGL